MKDEQNVVEVSISRAERDEYLNSVGYMTDKELLKMAAKAAGLKNFRYCPEEDGLPESIEYDDENDCTVVWMPHLDDGDATRLRNKLRMDVFYTGQGVNVAHDDVLLAFEPWGDDDCETERRAITRAAAAMVKE